MRVLHLCLASYYIEGSGYQESMVAAQNALDGHEVYVIASTLNCKDGEFFYDNPKKYTNKYGVHVDIVPFCKVLPHRVNKYLRKYEKLMTRIENIHPDIIVVHGAQSVDLAIVRKYVKTHTEVKLIVDTHAAYYNSAKNIISKLIFHKLIYRYQIKRCERYVTQFFAIGFAEKVFFHEMYNIEDAKVDILRLPGKTESEQYIAEKACKLRTALGIGSEIIFMHSGRMNKEKGTDELIKVFDQMKVNNSYLILAGRLSDDIAKSTMPLIERNERILYLGWISAEELDDYLCMADYYIQHLDVTATVQQAMCKGCGMILSNKIEEYKDYIEGNGFLINSEGDLEMAIKDIDSGNVDIEVQKRISTQLSKNLFDIRFVAKKLILED